MIAGLIAVMPVHLRSRNKRFCPSRLSEFGVGYSTGTAGRHTVVSDCLDVCECRTGPICSDEWAARLRTIGEGCTPIQLDVSKFRGPFFGGEEGGTIECHGLRPSEECCTGR